MGTTAASVNASVMCLGPGEAVEFFSSTLAHRRGCYSLRVEEFPQDRALIFAFKPVDLHPLAL